MKPSYINALKINSLFAILSFTTLLLQSCTKGWLDEKSDQSLVVPTKLNDYQNLLNNTSIFNINDPNLGELASDDYYLTFSNWQSLPIVQKNSYIWEKDLYNGQAVGDWIYPYQRIFYSNVILDGLKSIVTNEASKLLFNRIQGTALFFRAYNHYMLAQEFCKPFNLTSSERDLGIPLKLTADINETTLRSTVKQTYERILADLYTSSQLLPKTVSYKTQPSKAAAYALLARTLLNMNDFDNALKYADSTILLHDSLYDYNNLPNSNQPISRSTMTEIIFHSRMTNATAFSTSRLIIDSSLFRQYATNDLRRTVFFRTVSGNITYKGSYDGSTFLFTGLAIDEIYLIRAECYARKEQVEKSIADINSLLQKRWDKSIQYVPLSAANSKDALQLILSERRKQLCFRGLRWTDLRRLNSQFEASINLKRLLNNQAYNLPANDIKYVLPIPIQEIEISNIEQNER